VQRGTGKLAVAVEPHPVDSDRPTAQCCRTCRLVIVQYGGVAVGLSSYSPVSPRRHHCFRFKDVDQQISRIQSGTAGYMNYSHSLRPISHASR
jgi:hypothetical protein